MFSGKQGADPVGKNVLEPEAAADLDRLKKEYSTSEAHTKALYARDPQSPEYTKAEAARQALWQKIREIEGHAGTGGVI